MNWHPADNAYQRGKRQAVRLYQPIAGLTWDEAMRRYLFSHSQRDHVSAAYWLGVARALRNRNA